MAIRRDRVRARAPGRARIAAKPRKTPFNRAMEWRGKGRKWPTSTHMKRAPCISGIRVYAKPGKEGAIERELLASLNDVKGKRGVLEAGVYKLVGGSEGVPTHVLYLTTENPGVIERLQKNPRLQAKEAKLKRLATKMRKPAVNMSLIGRVSK